MSSAPPLKRRALLLLSCALLLLSACGVGEKRSGLPAGAQSSIDDITADIARGDFAKVYTDAADEWRQTASADESHANLERIRSALGGVLSRAQLSAQEREAREGRTLVVSYNTKFERADAIETFTLVERSGRWLLARYAVNSNALK